MYMQSRRSKEREREKECPPSGRSINLLTSPLQAANKTKQAMPRKLERITYKEII